MTALYASGDTRMSAVSRMWTSRKKKIATPVMRCSTQDHMPSFPRYRVPRGTREVVSDTDGVTRAGADTAVLPGSNTVGREPMPLGRPGALGTGRRRHAGAASILFPHFGHGRRR